MRIVVSLLFLLTFYFNVRAQFKYEREYRISEEEVPEKALLFLGEKTSDQKVKWYLEDQKDRSSIEAKFRYQNEKYSLEFDSSGNFEDLEILQKRKQITPEVWEKISTHLKQIYEKYKIEKIQVQYSGQIQSFKDFLSLREKGASLIVKYELVLKAKKQKDWNLYESSFKENGAWEKTLKIKFRNTDHLDY